MTSNEPKETGHDYEVGELPKGRRTRATSGGNVLGAVTNSKTTTTAASGTPPAGILRFADLAKVSSASRGLPMELKFLSQIEPSSPQPSVDRLSVTFAEEPLAKTMDKVHFPTPSQDAEHSDEEDYSASVTAIMQRRASVRRSKKRPSTRRGSSPFSPDILPENENGRRRSSVFTTSSGDTAITMEDSFNTAVTQEQIFENIKLHKEVLSSVKMQPWNMRKKLKLVMQAKAYIKKHEGALQERLAQSHSTRDMLARCNIYLIKKLQQMKREMANLSNWLIPWESRIKEIESHFGSVVASYFIFLRWLFWVNIALSALWIAFVAVPEMLTTDFQSERKSILPEDKYNATNFLTLWDFEGVFKYSPMFYGWYTNATRTNDRPHSGYRLPLAYFFTGLVVYIFSFVAILRKMAENSRMSKLSEKEDECIFSWKLFTGWDYMIGNAETAHNRVASIIMGFKEALVEEAEKKREVQSWKVIGSRVLVNIAVLSLLGLSAFAVITVVARSNEKDASATMWRRNETTVVMSLISIFFPNIFEALGYFEHYHPRKQLRLQLTRIMVLYLLNLYSLIFALFGKISHMTKVLQSFKHNDSILRGTLSDFDTAVTESNQPELDYSTLGGVGMLYQGYNELHIESLVSELWTTYAPQLLNNFQDDNATELYTTVATALTNLTRNYFEKSTTELEFPHSSASTKYDFEFDTTIFRSTFKEFLSTLVTIFENAPSASPLTTTDIVETLSTEFTTLIDSTLSPTSSYFEYYSSTLDASSSSTYFNQEETSDLSTDAISTAVSTIAMTTSSPLRNLHPGRLPTTSMPANTSIRAANRTLFNLTTHHGTLEKSIDTYESRSRLRSLCWETMFGQELVKLTVMDFVMGTLTILGMDFFRGVFVHYMNNCWCWDLERTFPQYGDFKVAENILHLVNNQGMVWMGMFFSPGLVVINVFKLYSLMYLKSWAVLTCNVPHEVIFRASRSNNFYYALLLMMLFLCVLPVSYAIVWVEPSWHCGPFSGYNRIFHIFTKTLKGALPKPTHRILDYIASPGVIIPLLMLLVLIIYYLISLSGALREANNDLKIQLRRERTEERRKMFQIADRRRRGGSDGSETNTPFGKWKKLLQGLPSNKSFDEPTPKQESIDTPPGDTKHDQPPAANKATLSKFILRAIKNRKQSIANEDVQQAQQEEGEEDHRQQHEQDDATDTEQHDSLPDDPTNYANYSDKRKINIHSEFKIKNFGGIREHVKLSRKDSASSNWSDNIPVITISKTESAEHIDENCAPSKITIDKQEVNDNGKPKVRYVLKKQQPLEGIDTEPKEQELKTNEAEKEQHPTSVGPISDNVAPPAEEINESAAVARKPLFQADSSSTQTTDTRTESSTDYKDSTFSN